MSEQLEIDLCFVRHAQTEANVAGIRQGHTDYPLTPLGIINSERLASTLRYISWDHVMCSDLPRAVKTLQSIQSGRSEEMEFEVDPILREVNFGIREGLPNHLSVEEAKKIKSLETGEPVDSIVDISESEADVYARHLKFLRLVHERVVSSKKSPPHPAKILCVTHGGFIRRLLSNCLSLKVDTIPNCSITIIRVKYDKDDMVCCPLEVCKSDHLISTTSVSNDGSTQSGCPLESECSDMIVEYNWPR